MGDGRAFFGCAWLIHDYITDLEEMGLTGRINVLTALVYFAASKLSAVLCFGLPAIIPTISGLVKLIVSSEDPPRT